MLQFTCILERSGKISGEMICCVFAAVSTARLGAKVVIAENNGFFGGVATAGAGEHLSF